MNFDSNVLEQEARLLVLQGQYPASLSLLPGGYLDS